MNKLILNFTCDACYRGERKILNSIKFKLFDGDKVAIKGKSGAGKTTLINAIMGISPIKIGDGNYFFNSNINFGYVPQETYLFSGSILENITMGRTSDANKLEHIHHQSSKLFSEFTVKNINKYLSKDVKIIIILRNPVERAYSGYQHIKRYNLTESLSFEKALDQSENRYHNDSNMTPASRYLELGMYFEQVKRFIEEFDNVHVIIYDDYKNDFSSEIDNVFKFLDVDAFKVNTEEKYKMGLKLADNIIFENISIK